MRYQALVLSSRPASALYATGQVTLYRGPGVTDPVARTVERGGALPCMYAQLDWYGLATGQGTEEWIEATPAATSKPPVRVELRRRQGIHLTLREHRR